MKEKLKMQREDILLYSFNTLKLLYPAESLQEKYRNPPVGGTHSSAVASF